MKNLTGTDNFRRAASRHTEAAFAPFTPAAPGLILAIPKKLFSILPRLIDVPAQSQWTEIPNNLDRTHLVLQASTTMYKLVLQSSSTS